MKEVPKKVENLNGMVQQNWLVELWGPVFSLYKDYIGDFFFNLSFIVFPAYFNNEPKTFYNQENVYQLYIKKKTDNEISLV